MKKIVLTGGGTAGRVMPNIALLPASRGAGYEVLYIGSCEGMECKLIEATNTPYYGISSERLHRYFDWKDFTSPFRILKGYDEAEAILRGSRPDLIFSKGGYVAVPVVHAAKRLGIPAVIHRSDMTPRLANRPSYSAATKICCNFPETLSLLPRGKAVLTGSPIRAELLSGSREAAYERIGFAPKRLVLLVIGGSLGSRTVNTSVHEALLDLLKELQVLHIADESNLDPTLSETPGYRQSEYISEELEDYFALADIMVNHAGANTICEILTLWRSNVLIPLSAKASHDNQILNTHSCEKQGYPRVLEKEALSRETSFAAVQEAYADRAHYPAVMKAGGSMDSMAQVISVLNSVTADRR